MSATYPIPRSTRDTTFEASDGQTTFGPLSWMVFDPDDVAVYINNIKVPSAAFTVVPTSPTYPCLFSVTLDDPCEAADDVRIKGERTHKRELNVTLGGAIRSSLLEAELDAQTTVMQELRRDVNAAVDLVALLLTALPTPITGAPPLTDTQKATARKNIGAQQGVDAKQFGAVLDGVTDDTAAIQALFNYCRDNSLPATIFGTPKVRNVTCYTSCQMIGYFVAENDAAITDPVFRVMPVASDISNIPLSEINAWTGVERGAARITGLTDRKGQFIYYDSSDEMLIQRLNVPTNFRLGDCFSVATNDGHVTPPLMATKTVDFTVSASVVAIQLRQPITISGVRVVLQGTASGERSEAIQIRRPNTIVANCSVRNDSTGPIGSAFQTNRACNVTYTGCRSDFAGVNSTQYGFNNDLACDVAYYNCSETNSRRGLDAHRAKGISIFGGSYPSGIGGHYVVGLRNYGAYVSANNSANPYPVAMAGGDFKSYGGRYSLNGNTPSLFRVRDDVFECFGSVLFDGDDVVLDDRDGNLPNTVRLVDLRGTTTAYNPGRTVFMPSNIDLRCSVHLLGAGSSTVVEAVSLLQSYPSFGQDIEVSGRIKIDCQWYFENGPDDGVNARARLVMFKPTQMVGGGYSVDVRNTPGFYVYNFCQVGEVNANHRNDFTVTNSRGINLSSMAYGTFKNAWWLDSDAPTFNFPGGTGGFSPIGDEQRISRQALFATNAETIAGAITTKPTNPAGVAAALANYSLKSQTADCFSGYIEVPDNKTYKLVVKIPHGFTITEATTISESGSCTATFKINGVALGGTANAVTTSEQSQAHSSSNVAAAGDDIQVTISANSSCVGLSFTLKGTRVLD